MPLGQFGKDPREFIDTLLRRDLLICHAMPLDEDAMAVE
jgi:hypothetical protein